MNACNASYLLWGKLGMCNQFCICKMKYLIFQQSSVSAFNQSNCERMTEYIWVSDVCSLYCKL